jgi:hypothetical protein
VSTDEVLCFNGSGFDAGALLDVDRSESSIPLTWLLNASIITKSASKLQCGAPSIIPNAIFY